MKGEKWEYDDKKVVLATPDDKDPIIGFRRAYSKLVADNIEKLTQHIETEDVNIITGGLVTSPKGKKYISCFFLMSDDQPKAQAAWNILMSNMSKDDMNDVIKLFKELGD